MFHNQLKLQNENTIEYLLFSFQNHFDRFFQIFNIFVILSILNLSLN
jgi:hypothetical protein